MSTIVLFTRDLRVHDQPALVAAVERGELVVPLFVLDECLLETFGSPNRVAFLLDSLGDLQRSLEARAGGLAVRRGDVVGETVRFALAHDAEVVHVSEDVSAYAQERERRLRHALAGVRIGLETFPGVTVVPPGELAPAGSDHFRVFTPYWRRWRTEPRRPVLDAPALVVAPAQVDWGDLPTPDELVGGVTAPALPAGGETAGRRRLDEWIGNGLARYAELRDDLAADGTSRLSPYLHFGCVSASELVERALRAGGGEEFARQLCWRDFHHQLLAADPTLPREDMRSRKRPWREDDEALAAWKSGQTGYPIVDAGMRQLLREGWMHNRARLVAGSFLTKHLELDWRGGVAHFFEHLVDGDVANNTGNWQWVAGTGADSRPYRMLSPRRQAERFDPDGAYARRYVPELGTPAYPDPIVVHEHAVARFLRSRRVNGWETTERLLESGGFESRQRVLVAEPVVETSEAGARFLGVTYWQAVDRFTRGSVRASWRGGGGKLRLLGGATLLCFGPPELSSAGELVSCRHEIQGGLLALRAGGSVTLAQRAEADGHELSVTVEEYLPRLAARVGSPWWTGALYAKGQSPFHAAVSRRYFELLVRESA